MALNFCPLCNTYENFYIHCLNRITAFYSLYFVLIRYIIRSKSLFLIFLFTFYCFWFFPIFFLFLFGGEADLTTCSQTTALRSFATL